MLNPLRDEWLHGPDADPDPAVAEAVALITEYQLGMLSDIERASLERRLKTDANFAALAEPMLFAARVMRERRLAGEGRPTEGHSSPPPRPMRLWMQRHVTTWRVAAALIGAVLLAPLATSAYGAIVRTALPPASVTFTNAPLSVVMADLRRRYHIDVEVCDVGFDPDRVTMTLKDAPVDIVVDDIAQQTLRIAHWQGPYVLRLKPQPDLSRGWVYNIRFILRLYTNQGCHR